MISLPNAGLHIAASHFPPVPKQKHITAFINANERTFREFKIPIDRARAVLEGRLRVLRHYLNIDPVAAELEPDKDKFIPTLSKDLIRLGRMIANNDTFAVCLDDMNIKGTGDDRVLVVPRNQDIICDVIAFQVFRINEFGSIMFLPEEIEGDMFDEIADLKAAQKVISPEDAALFNTPPVCTQRTVMFIKFTEDIYSTTPKTALERLW